MRCSVVFALSILLGACAGGTVSTPRPMVPEQGAFLVRLGNDTISVERYTRTETALEGDLLLRAPRARIVHYRATLGDGGQVTRYEATTRALVPGPATPRPQTTTMVFEADSARVEFTAGDSTRRIAMAATGARALPWLGAIALYEQAVLRARALGGDSVGIELVAAGQRQPLTMPVVRRGADTVAIDYFGSPMLARVDANGRILSLDGRLTTSKVIVDRVSALDFDALSRRFAAADSAGGPMGQLSPRDSVRVSVGAAQVSVDYGRPTRRGRTIFGTVVPWNQVWRTGANAATGLTTTADLVIGGAEVPAGSYTLWTLPSPSGTKLIINKQTGQWGTVYDAAQDLARVDMTSETLPSPVEQFTIDIVPQGDGAVMRMSWDRTRFSVPITVK
jgi:hypothetical protein